MSTNQTPDSRAEQRDRANSEETGALEALRASEIRYRRLFESAKDGILILDAETGMVSDVNPYLLDLLGYPRTEVLGKKLWELGFLADVCANEDRFAELRQEDYVRYDNLALEGHDGRPHEVEFISNVYPEGSHEVIQCNIRDISVRKRNEARIHHHSLRAEAEQRKSEETMRAMFDGIYDGILLIDAETRRFLNANGTMCRLLGYTLDEIRGLLLGDIHPPESLENVSTEFGRQARSEVALATNIPVLRKDGSVFSAEVNATALEIDGRRCLLGVFRDITARLRLESQLQQAQKMESMGRLAGGVAHDFNNMLGIILGHTDMIMEQMDPDQPFHANLTEIRKAGERSVDLTRQLLAFARKQTVVPKVIDLNKTVAGMTRMLHRLIGEDIDMAWIPGEKEWPVKIDPGQIDQILANLCVNARDAIAGVGKVTIETGNTVFDEDYCMDHAGFMPGQYAMLAVSDNGCGMDSETLSHLFEPFFTTKELGKGTGLGLATVYGVVKQNNGFINVYSEPGQGTTFKVYLPRHLTKAVPLPEKGPDKRSERGHETVLLVEDEPAILRMTSMMLEREGYTVVAAGTPGEAIRLANEHAGHIHLLMSDVVMPEMNCRDLAKNILSLYPHLKCLFMSGYTADVIAHHGVLDEGVNFIQKPFSKGDLTVKVREVLERD